jgi:L-threonylcarbamoyladenylate synthase
MSKIVPADDAAIAEAASIIRAGGLVAFPTETVYGLGANALDALAVQKIFEAKGRPASNPIIVHLASPERAVDVAIVSEAATRLMRAFWPGPLTLVLPKLPCVPEIVTAGGGTVGIRMPNHPVALALLEAAGVPIAAPSANRSEQISPTRAEHVLESLGTCVGMILDGGPAEVGLESTVLDLTVDPPRILRPGMIGRDQIEAVMGHTIAVDGESDGDVDTLQRSPGRMLRHYAPRTPMRLSSDVWLEALHAAVVVAVLSLTPAPAGVAISFVTLPAEPNAYAAGLYAALRQLDLGGASIVLVENVPSDEAWRAIRDRLQRASTANGIELD